MSENQGPEVFHAWIGQIIIAVVASLSGLAAGALLVHVVVFKILRNRGNPRVPVLDNALPYFFVNLLVLDVAMSIGSGMNAWWALEKEVYAGAYCTAQAVIKRIGNNGVAWQTTAIAVYSVAWYRRWEDRYPHAIGILVPLCIWGSLATLAAVPPSVEAGFYGPAGNWCFIPGDRDGTRIAMSYLWHWLCAVVTIVAYSCIYLHAAGRLEGAFGKGGVWIGLKRSSGSGLGCGVFGLPMGTVAEPIRPSPVNQDLETGSAPTNEHQINPTGGTNNEETTEAEHVQKAKQLMWYPFCYTLIIAPQSIIRIIELNREEEVPLWATVLCAAIFNMSGLINSILYWRGCRHFGIPEPIVEPEPQSQSTSGSGREQK